MYTIFCDAKKENDDNFNIVVNGNDAQEIVLEMYFMLCATYRHYSIYIVKG